jgi:hypothetical protein
MPPAKSKTVLAVEWLWSHRGKNIQWSPGVLTEANTQDTTAPKLTFVEATSIYERLKEKGLILQRGEQSPGNPTFILHESKEHEWKTFLSELENPTGHPKNRRSSATRTDEPDLTDPKKFAGHHITNSWAHLKVAWKAVVSIAVICFLAGFFLAWNLVVASKNATIETLQFSNADKQSRIDDLLRQSEKQSHQIAELRTYRGQDVLPLKRKALILAQQIREFTAGWKDTDADDAKSENVNNYLKRFGLRAQIMRDDLDQNGQQSGAFDKAMYDFQHNYQDVRTIAAEVEKLGKNLPD